MWKGSSSMWSCLQLLVERLHVDVDLFHLGVDRLHVDVDVGHLLRGESAISSWIFSICSRKGSMLTWIDLDLSHVDCHLLVDLAFDVFEIAVLDVELHVSELLFEGLHLFFIRLHVDFDVLEPVEIGLHLFFDFGNSLIVDLDLDVLEHRDLRLHLDLEILDASRAGARSSSLLPPFRPESP